MTRFQRPDEITTAAGRWLLDGGAPGHYSGPDPGEGHDLSPLLSRELGRERLALASQACWVRLEEMTRPVLDMIASSGERVWAFKGFDFARSLYPFPGARPMGDSDLFIRPGSIATVKDAFLRNGWSMGTPGDGILQSGIVSELKFRREGVTVEVHTHVFYFPATMPGRLPKDLFHGCRSLLPGLEGFSWHNALLMEVLHLLTHTEIRPVWWIDTALLCGRLQESGQWRSFASNALATGLSGSISEILAHAVDSMGAPVPERVLQVLGQERGRGENILKHLRAGRRIPTLFNLVRLNGWRRVSWMMTLFGLLITGRKPLKWIGPWDSPNF